MLSGHFIDATAYVSETDGQGIPKDLLNMLACLP
jgi:hypothetical protein